MAAHFARQQQAMMEDRELGLMYNNPEELMQMRRACFPNMPLLQVNITALKAIGDFFTFLTENTRFRFSFHYVC